MAACVCRLIIILFFLFFGKNTAYSSTYLLCLLLVIIYEIGYEAATSNDPTPYEYCLPKSNSLLKSSPSLSNTSLENIRFFFGLPVSPETMPHGGGFRFPTCSFPETIHHSMSERKQKPKTQKQKKKLFNYESQAIDRQKKTFSDVNSDLMKN